VVVLLAKASATTKVLPPMNIKSDPAELFRAERRAEATSPKDSPLRPYFSALCLSTSESIALGTEAFVK